MCARVAANLADGHGEIGQGEEEEEAELRKGNGASGVYVEPENVAKDNGGGNRWGRRNERESAEGGGEWATEEIIILTQAICANYTHVVVSPMKYLWDFGGRIVLGS